MNGMEYLGIRSDRIRWWIGCVGEKKAQRAFIRPLLGSWLEHD